MKNFRCYDLALVFYRIAVELELPKHLKDQLSRAASSIPLNLAEGAGRRTKPDQRQFFVIAMGSLRECQAIIDLMPIRDEEAAKAADILGAHLYKLIASCRP